MKILHTADVHLHTEHPRRLEALQELVSLGREENIDLLLIAGDLFDDHQQAELLRGETRRLFSNLPYKVLAIPGNHDERAFSQDSFWGADFSALTQQPCSVQDFGAWRIVAVPYTTGSFASLALRSKIALSISDMKKMNSKPCNVSTFCTLRGITSSSFFRSSNFFSTSSLSR